MTTSAPNQVEPGRTPAPEHRRRALVALFVLLLAALIARAVFLIWEPPFDGSLDYDAIAPLGESYWAMNLYVGGPAFAVVWTAAAIFIALLARGRSGVVTLGAAVLTWLSGTVFALVVTAEVLPFALAADGALFDEAAGRQLFDTFNASLGLLLPAILGSQLGVAVGILVFLVTAIATKVLPRWFSIAGVAYIVLFFALPFEQLGRGAVIAADLLQAVLIAGIGWFGLRAFMADRRRIVP